MPAGDSVKKIASCYKDDYICNGSLVRYFLKINTKKEGGMFQTTKYCNSKYTASLNKVLDALEQMELAERQEEDAYEMEYGDGAYAEEEYEQEPDGEDEYDE